MADPNDSANYSCTTAKNGALFYYFNGKKIKKESIPKQVLPSILCAQKNKALVSERTAALENSVAKLKKNLEKRQRGRPRKVPRTPEEEEIYRKSKLDKREEVEKVKRPRGRPKKNNISVPKQIKEPEKELYERLIEESDNENESDEEIVYMSPKRSPIRKSLQFASQEKPQSPPGRSPRKKILKSECKWKEDYDFLLYFYNTLRNDSIYRQLIKQTIISYEEDHRLKYPYKDREAILD
jgi:hypothetical protein